MIAANKETWGLRAPFFVNILLTGEHLYQRKSVYEAPQEKRKPARPDGLDNCESQALSAALSTDEV